MKWLMLVVLFHLLLRCCKCNKVINITSQDHLEPYLCHHYNYTGDTTLLLLDTLYNISGNGSLCTINTNYSLTIQGNHSMATIQCISSTYVNNTHPTIGFAFTGSSSLTLQRVTFIGCGANLTTLDKEQLNIINSTSCLVHFTQYHGAVLVFTEINHLVMRDVIIFQYYGFAIIAVNLPNGTLDSITVTISLTIQVASQSNYSIGSGVLFLYKNSNSNLSQYQVKITNSLFIHNYESIIYPGLMCATDFYNSTINKITPKPIINAAGLTILYTQNDTNAQVNISRCKFTDNIGSLAGAMLVLHLNTRTHSQTVIHNDSVFDTNGSDQKCYGSDIKFIMFFDQMSKKLPLFKNKVYYPFLVSDVVFTATNSIFVINKFQVSAVYMAIVNVKKYSMTFKLSNVTFKNKDSNCIFAATYPPVKNNIHFVINSVKAYNNGIKNKIFAESIVSPISLFHLSNINTITITGLTANPSNFSSNYGRVFLTVRSDIILEGHIVFHNNTGPYGAAIMLSGNSVIHLTQGLRAYFINNKALHSGGAIYASDSTMDVTQCTFQVNLSNYGNISVFLTNNTATVAGNSVYSSKLYNCYIDNKYITSTKIYDKIFNNNTQDISTTPVKLTMCDSYNSSISSYPGQKISFSIAAIDAIGHYSYSIITVTAVKKTLVGFTHINWWFSERENTQVISETDHCTLINVTIHTNDPSILPYQGNLLFTIPSIIEMTVVNINLKTCPPGFELDNVRGSCICSKIISSLNINGYTPNCNINTRTLNRPTATSWAGTIQVNNMTSFNFLLTLYCNHGYCNIGPNLEIFLYNSKDGKFVLTSKDLSHRSSLCVNNREGILCSKCSIVNGVNYSVVFGSPECRHCSNWWLWTLILYALAGPLLIYLLFALRLTLTNGTFNGIIFYAQAANVGILDLLSAYNGKMEVVRKISIVLLSLLNIGLGFPLCFYNGMTELWKTGLSLLFPLYLLTIVAVLIILSRYSLRLSNRIAHSSVQVLVTVVHLSFGKLLGAIINVFTPATVFTSKENYTFYVWYWDGSVDYASKEHIILMITTSLVVFPLLLPYVLLLVFTKPLRHWTCANEYTRPILEAIHAPYKNGNQYWFVARLLLLIMMYILYSIEPYEHTIYIAIASALFLIIIGQAMFRPYKSNFINLLDCWLLFNLAFIYTTTWYLGHMEVTVYIITSIILFFMTFFIILVYHVLFITGQLKKGERKAHDICTRISQYFSHFNQRSRRLPLQDANDSFYDSCDNYREPMLSSY